jgi:hypothetical protein
LAVNKVEVISEILEGGGDDIVRVDVVAVMVISVI